jgi:hypothetical protein
VRARNPTTEVNAMSNHAAPPLTREQLLAVIDDAGAAIETDRGLIDDLRALRGRLDLVVDHETPEGLKQLRRADQLVVAVERDVKRREAAIRRAQVELREARPAVYNG